MGADSGLSDGTLGHEIDDHQPGRARPGTARSGTDDRMSNDTRDSEPESATPDATGDPAEAPAVSVAKSDTAASVTKSVAIGAESSADEAEPAESEDEDYSTKRSPALIATAVALPVALVVGVLVAGVIANRNPAREPLAVASVAAPTAEGPQCAALLPELPQSIGDYTTAELRAPAPAATKAWQLPDGGEPIVLRCGLDRPLEFNRASPLQVVNGVNWFEVKDEATGAASGTWFAVDRGIYIAMTMPNSAGPTPLQDISEAIKKTIPEQPMNPGELPN